jgi:hypothetical protein
VAVVDRTILAIHMITITALRAMITTTITILIGVHLTLIGDLITITTIN